MTSLEDVNIKIALEPSAEKRFVGQVTAYLNRQASRLAKGNMTDQRVAIVLAQSAANLEQELLIQLKNKAT